LNLARGSTSKPHMGCSCWWCRHSRVCYNAVMAYSIHYPCIHLTLLGTTMTLKICHYYITKTFNNCYCSYFLCCCCVVMVRQK
jgi:hypothetical protein